MPGYVGWRATWHGGLVDSYQEIHDNHLYRSREVTGFCSFEVTHYLERIRGLFLSSSQRTRSRAGNRCGLGDWGGLAKFFVREGFYRELLLGFPCGQKKPRFASGSFRFCEVKRGHAKHYEHHSQEFGFFVIVIAKVFSDWHQRGRAKPLVQQYLLILDRYLEARPELAKCVVCYAAVIRIDLLQLSIPTTPRLDGYPVF